MTDPTPECRDKIRARVTMASVVLPDGEVLALLDAADERDRLSAAVERVRALADGWHSRGAHLMAYSKMPEVPDDMADSLLNGGAEFVERARLVRSALDARELDGTDA